MGTRTQRTRHEDRAQRHGDGTRHIDRVQRHGDGIEDRDRDVKEYGDWAEHGKRDTEMGQGMATETKRKGKETGTQSWEKASGQGHRDGTGTWRWDRVQGQSVGTEMEQGTKTQGWDLQDFRLPRDLLRSLLGQGRGLAL